MILSRHDSVCVMLLLCKEPSQAASKLKDCSAEVSPLAKADCLERVGAPPSSRLRCESPLRRPHLAFNSKLSTLNHPPAPLSSGRTSGGWKSRQCDDSEFQDRSLHGLDLLVGDTGKPGQELVHRSAVLEIPEKGARWHPNGFKHPGAAHIPGHPFDRRRTLCCSPF
jgi:hypothetical protein